LRISNEKGRGIPQQGLGAHEKLAVNEMDDAEMYFIRQKIELMKKKIEIMAEKINEEEEYAGLSRKNRFRGRGW